MAKEIKFFISFFFSFKVLPVSLAEVFLLELNLKFPTIQSFQKVSDMLSGFDVMKLFTDVIYKCLE
jgi:hypothetical protein